MQDHKLPALRDHGRTHPTPVLWWSWAGALTLSFQVMVLARWIIGPNFKPTPPGLDAVSRETMNGYWIIQLTTNVAALACFWYWVVRPWRRDGELSVEGRLFIAGAMIWFWDPIMSYTSATLFWNAYLMNFGSWTLGSWPGWMSPNANQLPEPLLFAPSGYVAFVVTQIVLICSVLKKARSLGYRLGILATIALLVVGLTIFDTVMEACFLRTGILAYPGGIRSLTLWAGESYQMPLTESFLLGGAAVAAIAAMSWYRNEQGLTWAEIGIEQLPYRRATKQWIRTLAVYGFVHVCIIVLYGIPNQWLALHSGPFPKGYPSYMKNGLCAYGPDRNQCPGPGVLMPRPPFKS